MSGEPFAETTDDPDHADDRNFYKVEEWTKDGVHIERMLYAGSNLKKAQEMFAKAIRYGPRIRLTIRQRTRMLYQWPEEPNTGRLARAVIAANIAKLPGLLRHASSN